MITFSCLVISSSLQLKTSFSRYFDSSLSSPFAAPPDHCPLGPPPLPSDQVHPPFNTECYCFCLLAPRFYLFSGFFFSFPTTSPNVDLSSFLHQETQPSPRLMTVSFLTSTPWFCSESLLLPTTSFVFLFAENISFFSPPSQMTYPKVLVVGSYFLIQS